ncbi:MAG: TonB-dependent siderophore receptor [Verrucomicrobiota bacterium]
MKLHHLLHSFVVLALASATVADSQTTTAPRTSDPGADPTIVLSPFTVNADKDTGYIANDVAAGGRLNTNLLETPADVSILTREFLDDLGVFSLADAYVWLPNSDFVSPGINPDWGDNASFRGLGGAVNTRNNVRFGTTAEEYSVERLEGNRGPNGVLFGDGLAGGQLNITTKQARFRNFQSLGVRVDSEGSRRVTVDVNRKVNEQIAVRLNLVAQQRRTWLERFYDDRYGASVSATYRPFKNTEIRFDGEFNYLDVANNRPVFGDESSLWDGVTTVAAPLTANPAAATGLSRIATDTLVYSPSWGNTIMNFLNFATTNGTGLTLVQDGSRTFQNFPVLPRREFQIRPDDDRALTRNYVATVTLQQNIGKLVTEFSYTSHAVWRTRNTIDGGGYVTDVNKVLPNGQANPMFGKVYSEGPWNIIYQDEFLDNFRGAVAYPFQFKSFSQIFGITGELREKIFDPESYTLGRSNGPNTNIRNAVNRVFTRRYWDDSDAPFLFIAPGESKDGYTFASNTTRDNNTKDRLKSVHFTTVGHYFHNRLTLIGGIRLDNFVSDQRNALTFTPDGKVATNRVLHFDKDTKVRSLGVTYFPVKSIGFYANWSEGFYPSYNLSPPINPSGTPTYTTRSVGKSAGLRFNVGDRKLIGSLGYYSTVDKDRQTVAPITAINQIWSDLILAERRVESGTGNVLDTHDFEGTGYELDLTANVKNNLRLKFNLALPRTEQQNTLLNYKAYVAENIGLWRAGANDPANANRTRIANNIVAVEDVLNSITDGRPNNRTYKWRANIFGVYDFKQDSRLKGFSIGGGANFYGRQLIGAPTGNPKGEIYAKEYYVVTGTLGYKFTVRKLPVRLSLAIANLLDYDDPVYNSVRTYQGVTYRQSYTYVAPRQATLTGTVTF